MSTQPVDTYIDHSLHPENSPLSIVGIFSAMIAGDFDELSRHDNNHEHLIGHNGFIGEIDGIQVILDQGPDGVKFWVEDDGQTWEGELTGYFAN